jgi:hypothetical protein
MLDASEPQDSWTKDGRDWRIGGSTEVAWIRDNTTAGLAITSAIPPGFEAYATLELPGTGAHAPATRREDPAQHDASVLAVLDEHTPTQAWWLCYLDRSGRVTMNFPEVPKVDLYSGSWHVLIEAGPEQASVWSLGELQGSGLPDVMFPTDRSWLVRTLWDDDWTCIGGSRTLVNAFLAHPDLRHRAREVDLSDEDATPPGHTAF